MVTWSLGQNWLLGAGHDSGRTAHFVLKFKCSIRLQSANFFLILIITPPEITKQPWSNSGDPWGLKFSFSFAPLWQLKKVWLYKIFKSLTILSFASPQITENDVYNLMWVKIKQHNQGLSLIHDCEPKKRQQLTAMKVVNKFWLFTLKLPKWGLNYSNLNLSKRPKLILYPKSHKSLVNYANPNTLL